MTEQQFDCDQALRHVLEYIDHELHAADLHAMETHLHTCKSCFSRMEFERRLKTRLGELGTEEPSSAMHERIRELLKTF